MKTKLRNFVIILVVTLSTQTYSQESPNAIIKNILVGEWDAFNLTGFLENVPSGQMLGGFTSAMIELDSANMAKGFYLDSMKVCFFNDSVKIKQKYGDWHTLAYSINKDNNSVYINFKKKNVKYRVFFNSSKSDVVLEDIDGSLVLLKKQ